MIRKYNYQRKKQITRDMFSISVENNEDYYYLKIDSLDLEGLDLDPDFEIFFFHNNADIDVLKCIFEVWIFTDV